MISVSELWLNLVYAPNPNSTCFRGICKAILGYFFKMPSVIRPEMLAALQARVWKMVSTHEWQEFYTSFIEEQESDQYLDDRRAELKALAGLKASCPKAPVAQ